MCNIKKCSKCGEIKDLEFFHNDSSKSLGKCNHCKECRKIIPKLSENETLFIFDKKRCSICKEVKLTNCFGKSKDSKLGFKPHCKTCDKLKREKIVFEIQEVEEKVCSGCNTLFPKSKFNKDKYPNLQSLNLFFKFSSINKFISSVCFVTLGKNSPSVNNRS